MEVKAIVFKLGIALSLMILMSACSKSYVTGEQEFNLVSEAEEIEMGREYDPIVVAEYGLYNDEDLAAYIDQLGQSIAGVSQRTNLDYTFRLLDTPMVNAFALPGGYLYVTRGILAYMNSEDEISGVVGHEVGHVVGRHSAKQMSKSVVASGFGVLSAVSSVLPTAGALLQAPGQIVLLKYSRDQEEQADLLGVEYSTRLGYDAVQMAGFFESLNRMSEADGQRPPVFLSTHPDPGDRYERVSELTREWQEKIDYQPLNLDPNDFLRRIDGIVYGQDPRAGFERDNVFYHPTLRFQLPVPKDWSVQNTPTHVFLLNKDKTACIQLAIGKENEPGLEADLFVKEAEAAVIARESTTVNRLGAETVESTIGAGSDKLHILSYFIKKDGRVYAIHGFTTEKLYSQYVRAFSETSRGFDNVTDTKVLNVEPRRVRVKPAPTAGNLKNVLTALGVGEDDLEATAIMNGKELSTEVEKGVLIKVVE
jgi:predicted Zn-dependent protease